MKGDLGTWMYGLGPTRSRSEAVNSTVNRSCSVRVQKHVLLNPLDCAPLGFPFFNTARQHLYFDRRSASRHQSDQKAGSSTEGTIRTASGSRIIPKGDFKSNSPIRSSRISSVEAERAARFTIGSSSHASSSFVNAGGASSLSCPSRATSSKRVRRRPRSTGLGKG